MQGEVLWLFGDKSAFTDFTGSWIVVTGGIRLALAGNLEPPILDITQFEG